LLSRSQGDLSLDGIINLHDLVVLQNALPAAGLAAITAAEMQAVPEPGTSMLLLLGAFTMPRRTRNRKWQFANCKWGIAESGAAHSNLQFAFCNLHFAIEF
jgi:hypothetical protein